MCRSETVSGMTEIRTYPHGVPSWVDMAQLDPEAIQDFYGRRKVDPGREPPLQLTPKQRET
jgi:hypothetical protein